MIPNNELTGNTASNDFPLDEWFDMDARIPKEEVEEAATQISFYAYKNGDDPDSTEVRQCIKELRRAVRYHNRQFVQVVKAPQPINVPWVGVDRASWFDTTKPIPQSEVRKVLDVIKEVLAGQPKDAIGSACTNIASACQKFNRQFTLVWVKKMDVLECASNSDEKANTLEGDELRASVEAYAKRAAQSAIDQARCRELPKLEAKPFDLSRWFKTDGRIGKQTHREARRKMLAAAGELTPTAKRRKTKAMRRAVMLHNNKFPNQN